MPMIDAVHSTRWSGTKIVLIKVGVVRSARPGWTWRRGRARVARRYCGLRRWDAPPEEASGRPPRMRPAMAMRLRSNTNTCTRLLHDTTN
ncbi:hypothetical protein EVAR_102996_1 [Eumeta japonica]|uniref:Uncharacterized protein n=1 Tax=Eumeta variegata TaxID=151549 RepID=A0A4C1UPM6_EUMVA|nr:hypothetical protein EVAR_102996_1 [Eumeta japonica]